MLSTLSKISFPRNLLLQSCGRMVTLPKHKNQARLLGKYAINFMKHGKPSKEVLERTKLFHTDSVICGLSALALKTNAPTVLRKEALKEYKVTKKGMKGYATVLGSRAKVFVEKAIVANSSAVREWDSNGTVFGINEKLKGHQAGEFGHNDFYPVAIAACQQLKKLKGKDALKAMVLSDEIRGRLAEVFSLKTYKIDHVVHGGIAAVASYGALLGATAKQIESAIGMYCAHYIPFRAIRAGKQLSDSKGASAAITTEVAILCIKRAMNGFLGPRDIFRNPEAIFRINQPTNGDSPFNIVLGQKGKNFTIMGMHLKLGLYEHQSAGSLGGLISLLHNHEFIKYRNVNCIKSVKITAYEPAFGIIGDPAKRHCETRQSADHSMVYIESLLKVATIIRKAMETKNFHNRGFRSEDDLWKYLMLEPKDYSQKAIHNKMTQKIMNKIAFEHGGKEFDRKYPLGIPTQVKIKTSSAKKLDSGLVMFPVGHARYQSLQINTKANLKDILNHKFDLLGNLALSKGQLRKMKRRLGRIEKLSSKQLRDIYSCKIKYAKKSIDA